MKILSMSRTPISNRRAPRLALASLALLAAPLAGHAASDVAMDACVKAFVAANLPKEQRVVVKMRDDAASPMHSLGRTYRVTLSAKGAQSGKSIATATCIVHRNGTVLALNGTAAPRSDATLAAAEHKLR